MDRFSIWYSVCYVGAAAAEVCVTRDVRFVGHAWSVTGFTWLSFGGGYFLLVRFSMSRFLVHFSISRFLVRFHYDVGSRPV